MAPQHDTGAGAEAELPEYAGHYKLESRLGSGGMGVVHRAQSGSGMTLAVKIVHAEFAKDPEFRGRFRQEIAAARRVSGAFTAPVVDADPDAERPWMATLFIPGPTLADEVKRNGPMAAGQLRRLMAGLAEALRDIHRVGVVHRDLKPSNVLLAEDGPKVIDFGISRPKDSELRTETGKLIGTPPFMAPEQFRRPREVGPAADIFALGSVLVHAATGRGPFDSDSPYVVAYQVVHDEPDLTGVPANLAPLIVRCLAKEPEDRPTPDELMRELRSVAASYDTQAFIPAQRAGAEPVPEPRAEKPEPRRGRRTGRAMVLGVGGLVLAGIVALASVHLLGGEDTPPRTDSAQTGSARTTPAGFDAWATKPRAGKGGLPRCSYGAQRLLCTQAGLVSALAPADGHVVWRHALGKGDSPGEPPVLSGGLVHVLSPSDRQLLALDPSSGSTRWKLDLSAYLGFRHVGAMLLLTSADGKVTGVDSASGKPKWTKWIPGAKSPLLYAFPGSPLAYATSRSADGSRTRVTAVDPATGDVRWDEQLDGTLKPVGGADGKVFFLSGGSVRGESDAVVRYDPVSGDSRRVALTVPVYQAQAGVDGDRVLLMGTGGSLVAVDLSEKKQSWSLETSVSQGSAPVTDGRLVYVSAADGRLLAVDAEEGRLLGQTPPRLDPKSDEVAATLSTPQVLHGHVYATAPDGTVFAVNARNPSAW
ncbi:PQQ-binding-like beta-propeller repeat protein [Streptomyces sp. S3(2020)]|uniref:serine/threonine-protein kinase n=1 Tax=Streptomyces sp. S3(2020) TaxID=2732044 RepID=UPI001489873C|nr:serine/threonine-protein kinase [Streptomyces sp. S3(2020)]NNN35596.1 PQQ-binding-like beta-propeller repeat protein [Streptomyces sp. S3(2020)]